MVTGEYMNSHGSFDIDGMLHISKCDKCGYPYEWDIDGMKECKIVCENCGYVIYEFCGDDSMLYFDNTTDRLGIGT